VLPRRERRMREPERRRGRRAARRGSGWRHRRGVRRGMRAGEEARDGCTARGGSAMQWPARREFGCPPAPTRWRRVAR